MSLLFQLSLPFLEAIFTGLGADEDADLRGNWEQLVSISSDIDIGWKIEHVPILVRLIGGSWTSYPSVLEGVLHDPTSSN